MKRRRWPSVHRMRGWIWVEYLDAPLSLIHWKCAGCGCLVTAHSDVAPTTCYWPRTRNCPNAEGRR